MKYGPQAEVSVWLSRFRSWDSFTTDNNAERHVGPATTSVVGNGVHTAQHRALPSPSCPIRDADNGYTLSVGRGQPVVAAAAAAASDGMALPTVFEQAAAGVGVGGVGMGVAQVCIVRDGETAKMGGCEEQTRLTLQVRETEHLKFDCFKLHNGHTDR